MKNNNSIALIIIIVLVFILLLSGVGMMGFGGMMHGYYGSSFMCGQVGGIWCYWPNWMWVFGWLFMILIIAVLILLIIWLSNLIQHKTNRRRKR